MTLKTFIRDHITKNDLLRNKKLSKPPIILQSRIWLVDYSYTIEDVWYYTMHYILVTQSVHYEECCIIGTLTCHALQLQNMCIFFIVIEKSSTMIYKITHTYTLLSIDLVWIRLCHYKFGGGVHKFWYEKKIKTKIYSIDLSLIYERLWLSMIISQNKHKFI